MKNFNNEKDALNNLKPKYREVATLNFIEGRSYKEIANILQIPINTVKVTLLRAKEMLQNELQNEYLNMAQ